MNFSEEEKFQNMQLSKDMSKDMIEVETKQKKLVDYNLAYGFDICKLYTKLHKKSIGLYWLNT